MSSEAEGDSVECNEGTVVATVHQSNEALPEFHLQFDSNKAGLEKADAERTTAIIQEASKGSGYYMNERRKAESRQKHILELRQKSAQFAQYMSGEKNMVCRKQWERRVTKIEVDLEAGRQFGNYIHADMDMFYAAVEMKKNPSLVDVPLGVGSMEMLSTTNYVARRYGVRSGMPGYIGVKLCPALVIVPADFDAYRAEAAVVRAIAADYDPRFASVGLDELTMEVTAYLRRHPGTAAADVAAEFRARVFSATRLTASAGIGPTATLSKIASNYKKPDGQHELRLGTREEVIEFMKDLPVRTVPGIGRCTESILQGLGISRLGEIYDRRYELCYILTEKTFRFLLSAAIGVVRWVDDSANDGPEGSAETERKSIGMERTFKKLSDRAELKELMRSTVEAVHGRLVKHELLCRQIMIKTKRVNFEVHDVSKSLQQYTDNFETLCRGVDELMLPLMDKYASFRLVGVRLADIITRAEYESLQQGGVQCTLLQFCSPGKGRMGGRIEYCGAKRTAREEESNNSEVFICSGNEDKSCVAGVDNSSAVVMDGDDDVIYVSPPVKMKRSEGSRNNSSRSNNDIIMID